MARKSRYAILRCLILGAALFFSASVQASEFLRLCEASKAKAEAFLAECRSSARPFKRAFFPGGRGAPVEESHRAWFDTPNAAGHFGYGCVLGPNGEPRFLGLYFFLERSSFLLAYSADLAFIDLEGNVGLRRPGAPASVLLATHKLSAPGYDVAEGNCEIGRFDRASNETVERSGGGFRLHRVSGDVPASIVTCLDSEIRYRKGSCSTQTYSSFLADDVSPIIYGHLSIKITEAGRLYVDERILHRFCVEQVQPLLEFLNFVKELCGRVR